MVQIKTNEIQKLHNYPNNIRNICIIAHVDHGKTTLCDSLISSNGIISSKLAGKIRFLDNTEEEQKRGITMKSSVISLLYETKDDDLNTENEKFLINLIDSPGHVDFSYDVATGLRLCDGAIVLVDVIEGVCAQTHSVLRQAWQEGVRPCLVLNKIDRLITELRMTPLEAYEQICRILEQTNVIICSLNIAESLNENEIINDTNSHLNIIEEYDQTFMEDKKLNERNSYFSPHKGNVLFASAYDGWAFGIGYFAKFHFKKFKKFNYTIRQLRTVLWGNYYFDKKSKKITKNKKGNDQPMFVECILNPIWEIYKIVKEMKATCNENKDRDINNVEENRLSFILKSLQLDSIFSNRKLYHTNRRIAIQSIMKAWLPLSQSILRMVIRNLPSPVEAQGEKIDKIWPNMDMNLIKNEQKKNEMRHIYNNIKYCITNESKDKVNTSFFKPVVAFISKMISVNRACIMDEKLANLNETNEILVAIIRIYSGMLDTNSDIYILSPHYDCTSKQSSSYIKLNRNSLSTYIIMGQDIIRFHEPVGAGNIIGIVGLHDHVIKTATLSHSLSCPSLSPMIHQAHPIVRVAIEPEDPRDFYKLEQGLQMLYRTDPTILVQVQETGEHVIAALGELHLERCIKDLKDRFVKTPFIVSKPIVSFKETIVEGKISNNQKDMILKEESCNNDEKNDAISSISTLNHLSDIKSTISDDLIKDEILVSASTSNNQITIFMYATPLPIKAAKYLENIAESLKSIRMTMLDSKDEINNNINININDYFDNNNEFIDIENQLKKILYESNDIFWINKLDQSIKIVSFGPRHCGPNILFSEKSFNHIDIHLIKKIENSIINGFQIASSNGPLCGETLFGVAFFLHDIIFKNELLIPKDFSQDTTTTNNNNINDIIGPGLSGQIISITNNLFRKAILRHPIRLVEAMYTCSVQCQVEQLGKLYDVLSKRRSIIIDETLSDGTSLFLIKSYIPVIESFGISSDILSKTSGACSSPLLEFSHWVILEKDPYFQPSTIDERELHGEKIMNDDNIVMNYINNIRERKGLPINKKIVIHAEKQRTLTRNK